MNTMIWLAKMNDALQYIEENLEGRVDHRRAAEIACASLTRFQRMFTFMSDMTVGDYIRFRKMTLAAEELQKPGARVIDVALKYGYDSPDAFTRAFRTFHGVSPTAVKKGAAVQVCPPITFEVRTQNGNTLLGSKPLIRLEELNARKAVAFTVNGTEPETRAWNLLREWAVQNLPDYAVRRYIGFAPQGHHPDGPEETAHEYCAMMLLHSGECEDDDYLGAKVAEAPGGLFLVGDVVLNEYFDDGAIDIGLSMKNASQTVYECMLNTGGYALDFDGRTYLEEHIFLEDWFTADRPEVILPEYKFWLPVKKQ